METHPKILGVQVLLCCGHHIFILRYMGMYSLFGKSNGHQAKDALGMQRDPWRTAWLSRTCLELAASGTFSSPFLACSRSWEVRYQSLQEGNFGHHRAKEGPGKEMPIDGLMESSDDSGWEEP